MRLGLVQQQQAMNAMQNMQVMNFMQNQLLAQKQQIHQMQDGSGGQG